MVRQAGAVVFRTKSHGPEILLVKARNSRDWIFPKGHVQPDEHLEAAAVRETLEETGVVGRVVAPLFPVLKFQSGKERVSVQYFLLVATSEGESPEGRDKLWLEPASALAKLTHKDAKRLLREATREIAEEVALSRGSLAGDISSRQQEDRGLQELLLKEYEHAADSLLRNEEDGERRVTSFVTIAASVGAVLGFVMGDVRGLTSETLQPLLVFALAAVLGVGYLTFLRILHRNAASDKYKGGLNRIRRYFVRSPEDSRAAFLAFDPFRRDRRPRYSWLSLGKGGWLETVVFTESIIAGALGAVMGQSYKWPFQVVLIILSALVTWILLFLDADRRSRIRS
jgi:8-oxo-dGTP pyrophosphatase MutT (NUDIX family)